MPRFYFDKRLDDAPWSEDKVGDHLAGPDKAGTQTGSGWRAARQCYGVISRAYRQSLRRTAGLVGHLM